MFALMLHKIISSQIFCIVGSYNSNAQPAMCWSRHLDLNMSQPESEHEIIYAHYGEEEIEECGLPENVGNGQEGDNAGPDLCQEV